MLDGSTTGGMPLNVGSDGTVVVAAVAGTDVPTCGSTALLLSTLDVELSALTSPPGCWPHPAALARSPKAAATTAARARRNGGEGREAGTADDSGTGGRTLRRGLRRCSRRGRR